MASAKVLLAQQQDSDDKMPSNGMQPERAPSLDVKKLTASIHGHGTHLVRTRACEGLWMCTKRFVLPADCRLRHKHSNKSDSAPSTQPV